MNVGLVQSGVHQTHIHLPPCRAGAASADRSEQVALHERMARATLQSLA
jgi:hypothetical protein